MTPAQTGRTSVNLLRELLRNSLGSLRVAPLARRTREGPVRIAFQAYSIHLAQMFRTIAVPLLRREGLEVSFLLLSHPQFPPSTVRHLRDFARDELGVPDQHVKPYHDALWERFDLAIYNDVYARFPLAPTRNVLLTHGPLLEDRFLKPSALRKSVSDFDLVAVCGQVDFERVRRRFEILPTPPELVSVGFPFLDRLASPPVDRERYLRGLGLDPGRSTILLAPHWKSLRGDGIARFERTTATLGALDSNVVIKPHACSLVQAMAGGIDWRERLPRHADGRVAVDLDPDDVPALAHSDVLVTERSSRSLVFMLLGKPTVEIIADAPSTPAESARLDVIRAGVHMARTAEDLMTLLAGSAPLAPRPAAAAIAARCIDHPGATDRFLEIVDRSLPIRTVGSALTAVGVRLDTSTRALGRPRDSSPLVADTSRLRERLAEDGYLYLRGFFDVDDVLGARRQLVASLAERGMIDRSRPVMESAAASHARIPVEGEGGRFPAVRELLHGERMLSLYRRLLGGAVRHYDFVWLRLMNPGQATGPHCDIVYMGRGTSHLYTSWVPLGDVPLSHGALTILEGSHRLVHLVQDYVRMDVDRDENWTKPRFRHGRLFRGGDYSRNPRAVQRQFKRRWLTTDYRAGDLVLFHAQTMHGSLDNTSETLRLSADTRFQLASEPVDERWVGPRPPGHARKE